MLGCMDRSLNAYPYLCSELVLIARTGAAESQAVQGNLEAIGERSAMVLTEVPVKPGVEINIIANFHILRGYVERCSHDSPLGCYIEVRLNRESRWSEQRFRPQHLLALSATGASRKMCLSA